MEFGKAIKTIRAARGLTQEQLAKETGRDTSFISRIESGDREPSLTSLRDIATALGVPLYLLTLLASDTPDLAGADPRIVDKLGRELLSVILGLKVGSRRATTARRKGVGRSDKKRP